MKVRRSILAISILTVFVLLNTTIAEGAEGDAERKLVISTNPILAMFTWWNGELELKVASNSTIGVAGSYITFGGDEEDEEEKFISAAAFYRFYPQGDALAGFFFGGRFGYYNVEGWDEEDQERKSGDFYGFGIDIGYSWLLGESRRFNLSLGIGAVRLFGGDLEDVALTLPTIRLVNIGVAF